jgi:peptidoglycan hydrolase CwlO-like protein
MEQSIAFLVGVILVLVIMNIIRSTRLNSRVTSLEYDLETIIDGIEEELGYVRDELADLTSDCQELLDDLESLEERLDDCDERAEDQAEEVTGMDKLNEGIKSLKKLLKKAL